jgi:phage-related protein
MRENLILKRELNSIFNRVYSINESLSIKESREFMRGFEDGINEGLFGWLGKQAGYIAKGFKNAYDWTKNTIKSAYEEGKELAGKAWDSIKKFAESVASSVKKGFDAVVKGITQGIAWCRDKIMDMWDSVTNMLKEAYKTLKEKSEALGKAIIGIWTTITTQIMDFATVAKDKIVGMGKKAVTWFEQSKNDIKEAATEAKQSTVDGIRKLGGMLQGAFNYCWDLAKKGAINTAKGTGAVLLLMIGLGSMGVRKVFEAIKAIPGIAKDVYDKCAEATNKFIKEYIGSISDFSKEFEKSYRAQGQSEKESRSGDNSGYAAGPATRESMKYILPFERF